MTNFGIKKQYMLILTKLSRLVKRESISHFWSMLQSLSSERTFSAHIIRSSVSPFIIVVEWLFVHSTRYFWSTHHWVSTAFVRF